MPQVSEGGNTTSPGARGRPEEDNLPLRAFRRVVTMSIFSSDSRTNWAQAFISGVDAAAVMVNASTRFTDGAGRHGQF